MRIDLVALFVLVFYASVYAEECADDAQGPSIMLNMLVKDEAAMLSATLPKWKGIVDYWVIGVDEENQDETLQIIEHVMQGVPGKVVRVSFEGMGPTWTKVIEFGLQEFPQATHGICADADFSPILDSFDKSELSMNCGKHSFQVLSPERKDHRYIDWIYRNIPGVRMTKRAHQRLVVPFREEFGECSNQLVSLYVTERSGGYQDRSGGKNERYLDWLLQDLEDDPEDAKTVFYIGQTFLDLYRQDLSNTSRAHGQLIRSSVDYFKRRIEMDGDPDETYFAMLRLGQIYETIIPSGWSKAREYYEKCIEMDPEIARAWFRIGQHFRRQENDYETALMYLEKAVRLSVPRRNAVIWAYLYTCLSKLEYSRAVFMHKSITKPFVDMALYRLKEAEPFCQGKHDQERAWLIGKLGEKQVSEPDSPEESLAKIKQFIQDHFGEDLGELLDYNTAKRFNHLRNSILTSDSKTCDQLEKVLSKFVDFLNSQDLYSVLPRPVATLVEWESLLSKTALYCTIS